MAADTERPFLRERRRYFWPFVLPALTLYALVFGIPIIGTVIYSFARVGPRGELTFRGLDNYVRALHDDVFWSSLQHTFVFAAESTLVLFVPGLFIAWCLSQRIRFRRFYRIVVFAPVVLSVLVAAVVWRFIFNPSWGLLNTILRDIGLEGLALPWLGDDRTAMLAVVIAAVWQNIGLWVVLISAGLERISPEILESARIDGASARTEFFRISLPLLWPVLRILILLWTIGALQLFAFVYVMTGGGPAGETQVVASYIYGVAFTSQSFGYAAALATLVLIIAGVVTLLLSRVLVERDFEDPR